MIFHGFIVQALFDIGFLFKSKIFWSYLLLTHLANSLISSYLANTSVLVIHKLFNISSQPVRVQALFALEFKAQYFIILLSLALLITLTAS
tara:strand:+ start:1338 stop:1610 length:273 start_codon:yes stop_codon:yes gene_type:complete